MFLALFKMLVFFFVFLYSNQGVQGQIDRFAKVEDQAQLVPHVMTKKYRNRVAINLTLFIQRGMARSMGNFGWGLNLPFMYERTWCLESEDNNEDGRWSRAYTCLNQGNNNFRRLVKIIYKGIIDFIISDQYETLFLKSIDARHIW